MRRVPVSALVALLVLVLLTSCGGTSPPDVAGSGPRSTSTSPSGDGPATSHGPFVPHTAVVRTPGWRLPVASARQALVSWGHGRVLLAGGLLAGDASTGRTTRIDLGSGRASSAAPLAVPVHDVAGGRVDGVPLVVGGGNATEQDVVQALHGGRWRVVGHLPTTRSDLAVVATRRGAWVVGGYDGTGTPTALLSVGADGSVVSRGNLVVGVRYAATAVVGHTAYVFGGEVLGHELDTVQAVDLRTGQTRIVARLPVPLGHAMAAPAGARILLVGGRTAPDTPTDAMWWFDPGRGRFHRAGRLPHPLSDAAVATWGHRVWLLGGEDPEVTAGVLTISER